MVECSISPSVSGESCQAGAMLAGQGEEDVNAVVATPEGPALASATEGCGSGSSSKKARQGRISNNSANIFRLIQMSQFSVSFSPRSLPSPEL